MSIRVIVADDHQLIREGLCAILERESGKFEVVGQAAEGSKIVKLAAQLNPDIVLMDIGMPGVNGLVATQQIVDLQNASRVIAVSIHNEQQYVQGILKAGASGYLLKDSAGDELIQAINDVANGRVYLSPRIGAKVVDGLRINTGSQKPLTPRERQVLQGISDGRSTKKIAFDLGVSDKTIETHRRSLMRKLEIFTVAELTKYAIRQGLTALE